MGSSSPARARQPQDGSGGLALSCAKSPAFFDRPLRQQDTFTSTGMESTQKPEIDEKLTSLTYGNRQEGEDERLILNRC